MKYRAKQDTFLVCLGGIIVLAVLAFWVGIGYVALHYVNKFW